jgi:hypothetical protein
MSDFDRISLQPLHESPILRVLRKAKNVPASTTFRLRRLLAHFGEWVLVFITTALIGLIERTFALEDGKED